MGDQTLAYLGIIIAVLIPIIAFGWRLLTVTSKVSNTLDRVSTVIEQIVENMISEKITHEQIVARMKVFETKMDAELKAINVRLDHIEDKLGPS